MKVRPAFYAVAVTVPALVLMGALQQAQSAAPRSGDAPPSVNRMLPLWAYPIARPRPRAANAARTRPADDSTLLTEPDSKDPGYTRHQLDDLFVVPDWYPDEHPTMPSIVAEGRKPDIGACGHCHLPTGYGRPENESLDGLSAAYMTQQISDFKNGLRKSSEPRLLSVTNMILCAKALTPEEIKSAVDYFVAIKPVRWIRVIETDTVPKTHPADLMLVVDPGTEPIGNRVVEVSKNLEQTELRSTKSGFVAYVPKGSLKRGEALVRTPGKGETMACTTCHGPDLKGAGTIPSIAGRSPSQMARQLIDFQTGARKGADSALMQMPVAKLTDADIVAITGYLASLEP